MPTHCDHDVESWAPGETVYILRELPAGRGNYDIGSRARVLAERVETANGSKLTDADMRKLYDAGYDAGVRAAETKQHGPSDFRNVDGTPA